MSKRVMKRSKSFPDVKSSFFIDSALSLKIFKTSGPELLPKLTDEEYAEVIILREKLEAQSRLVASLRVENKAVKKELEARTQLVTSLRDQNNRSEDKLKAAKEELKAVKYRFDSKVHLREALTEFKRMCDGLDRALMSQAYKDCPGVFPNGVGSFTTMIRSLTEQQLKRGE